MRYLMFALFAWLLSCAGNNDGMGTKRWPPNTNPNDTATETDTDSDADSDADSDTDSDSGTDECAEAAELCGMNLDSQIELRGIGWGVDITTQYAGYADWTDAEQVAAGIAAGYYPPVPSFPDVSSYPRRLQRRNVVSEQLVRVELVLLGAGLGSGIPQPPVHHHPPHRRPVR